jgi:hypothetical protein
MEMAQRESLLALGAGPQPDEVGLPPFALFRQVNLREAIRTERMAFAVLPNGIKIQGRFSLAATATGLGGALFHDEINMKTPPGFGNDATLGLMAYQ